MKSKISVIIPIYNVEEYLDACVQSVVSQTYQNLEIILVDDGSPDRCPQMCDRWAERDSRIKVIHKQNGGVSDARNAGIEVASGDYIAFVDSDDWIMPEMYEKMLHTLLQEQADICACNIKSCYIDHEESWGCIEYTVGNTEQILNLLYSDTVYPVSVWNKLYRRSCWKTLRFPVGKICEDAFTTYLLVHEAKRIVQIPQVFYCYRIRPQSIMTSAFSSKRMDEEEAWRVNYQFVANNYPALRRKAFDFYLQKVSILLQTIPKQQRKEFASEYKTLRQIFRKNLFYIAFFSQLRLKQRLKLLCDYFIS